MERDEEAVSTRRWRLILGEHSQKALPELNEHDARLDRSLSFLYDREQASRGHRLQSLQGGDGVAIPVWLEQVRSLFPPLAVAVLEEDALSRYGLSEVLLEDGVLEQLTPSVSLMKILLSFRSRLQGRVLVAAKALCQRVVHDLLEEFSVSVRQQRGLSQREVRPLPSHRNIDWKRTITRNLKNYDTQRRALLVDRICYDRRGSRTFPFSVIVVVDQSGSMMDSLISAAIMANVFSSLNGVNTKLILFDHRVVDVSDQVKDPLELMFSVQLGGGTKMYNALEFAKAHIDTPSRTLLVVISDWMVNQEKPEIIELATDLAASGVRGFALAASNGEGTLAHDEQMLASMQSTGWYTGPCDTKTLVTQIAPYLR